MAAKFINRNKTQSTVTSLSAADDLNTRQELASQARVIPGSLKALAQSQHKQSSPRSNSTPSRRNDQQQRLYDDDDGARSPLWANTTMGDDSDDTTRGLGVPNVHDDRGEQPLPNVMPVGYAQEDYAYEQNMEDADNGSQYERHDEYGNIVSGNENHDLRYAGYAQNGGYTSRTAVQDSHDINAQHVRHTQQAMLLNPTSGVNSYPSNALSYRNKPPVPQFYENAIQENGNRNPALLETTNDMGRIAQVGQRFAENPEFGKFQHEMTASTALSRLGLGNPLVGRFNHPNTKPSSPPTEANNGHMQTPIETQQGPARNSNQHYQTNTADDLPSSEGSGSYQEQASRERGDEFYDDDEQDPAPNQQLQRQLLTNYTDQRDTFATSEGELEDDSRPTSPEGRGSGATTERSTPVLNPLEKKRQAVELDYDETSLQNMKYAELKAQPFDDKPRPVPSQLPRELLPQNALSPNSSLEERLEYYKPKSIPLLQKQQFFSGMSVDDWETSGDWFLERFGDIMKELKDARKSKRDIARRFEDEIAGREEAVRAKSDKLGTEMKEMKVGGMQVLAGKGRS